MRQFSERFIEKEFDALGEVDFNKLKIGFVGNMANGMYMRAYPLRRFGAKVNVYIHPQDNYIMGQPSWEEFDGTVGPDISTIADCQRAGLDLPVVHDVYCIPDDSNWEMALKEGRAPFLRPADRAANSPYLCNWPLLKALQDMDVLWGIQYVYLSYLANRPYVVSQMGGDLWMEASRKDELGRIQRLAFGSGRAFLVSNPWSFAHARRFGFKNFVCLPFMVDDALYSPGQGSCREQWEAESGGSFFVLTSSRLDERNKGSSIGIEGFARFSRANPMARLVVVGWGKDAQSQLKLLARLGIADRVIVLPISGKARLREYLRSADVFIDQFVLGYYGAAGVEAMGCGLPVIARVEASQYEALFGNGRPPIINVDSDSAVADALGALADNDDYRRQLALEHRRWFLINHGSTNWLGRYRAVLAATALGRPADYSQSPLNQPLSPQEQRYHADGLAGAPPYPEYGW